MAGGLTTRDKRLIRSPLHCSYTVLAAARPELAVSSGCTEGCSESRLRRASASQRLFLRNSFRSSGKVRSGEYWGHQRGGWPRGAIRTDSCNFGKMTAGVGGYPGSMASDPPWRQRQRLPASSAQRRCSGHEDERLIGAPVLKSSVRWYCSFPETSPRCREPGFAACPHVTGLRSESGR